MPQPQRASEKEVEVIVISSDSELGTASNTRPWPLKRRRGCKRRDSRCFRIYAEEFGSVNLLSAVKNSVLMPEKRT